MKNFNTEITKNSKDEWLTPPSILKDLGVFDLDPCSPVNRPWDTAKFHYSVKDNGLQKRWIGRVWLNPPYGRETFRWLARLSHHKRGLALIFARTETIGFHEYIWNKADSIFFFKGRIKFFHVDGKEGNSANAPSCLVSYSKEDSKIIRKANFEGKFINLDREG